MATSMDVDPQHNNEESSMSISPRPTSGGEESEEAKNRILVHPLAIVTMSDQYTRIRFGGSPMDSDAQVTGLLLGTTTTTTTATTATTTTKAASKVAHSSSPSADSRVVVVVEVRDAEDIPLDLSESAQLQVELHRAVFPAHHVVGWYRVAETDDVLESDVILTDQLAQHYRKAGNNNSAGDTQPFLFALLAMNDSKTSSGNSKEDDDEDDEPLPLSVYRPSDDGGGVLHNVPDWALETLDSERIAVERVIRERPPSESGNGDDPDAATAAATTTSTTNAAGAMTSLSLDGPRFVQHTNTLEHSLTQIHRRLDVLRTYLQDTMDGKIPYNPSLMRQVNEVMLQAEAIHRPTNNNSDTDALLVPLAYLLKTVDAVRSYSDKFRAVHESSTSSSTSTSGSALSTRSRDRDYAKRM